MRPTQTYFAHAQKLPLVTKAACALVGGALGAVVGNPADVSLVRMQADGTLPLEQRRGYKNVFDAIAKSAP